MMFLLWTIIILIIIYLLFDYLTRDYLNPYKLIMVFGKKGSGKTTYLTKVAIKAIKQGKNVYSTIRIPGTLLFDVNELGKYTFVPNSVVLIDEVGMIWDNRNYKDFKPHVRDFFKFQRQYKLKVYLFSQTFDVDLKLRNLTDEMYLLTNFMRVWSLARRIKKRITIAKGSDGQPSSLADDYEFCSILDGHPFELTFIPRWTPYFESYDPTKLFYIDYEKQDMTPEQELLLDGRLFYWYGFQDIISNILANLKTFFFGRFKK